MGRRLAGFVHVTAPDGGAAVFGPDDELPAWASKAIPNAKAWADDEGTQGAPEKAEVPAAANDDAPADYQGMKVADLRALIAERNEGRDEDDLIPDDGNKADLIAALEADDESD